MEKNNKPYGIECSWDSEYLCKKCGGLIYYDMETKIDNCFKSQCQDYPKGIEIYRTEEADLTLLNKQFADIERGLGQIISTCDYKTLAMFLLERRRRIVQKFFTSGIMNINNFLLSNEILLFIQSTLLESPTVRSREEVLPESFSWEYNMKYGIYTSIALCLLLRLSHSIGYKIQEGSV